MTKIHLVSKISNDTEEALLTGIHSEDLLADIVHKVGEDLLIDRGCLNGILEYVKIHIAETP